MNLVNFYNYGVVILLIMFVKYCYVGLLLDDNISIYCIFICRYRWFRSYRKRRRLNYVIKRLFIISYLLKIFLSN